MLQTKECRRCHRIGTRDFLVAGCEGWECGNDRACKRRAEQRERAEGERRWNEAVDALLNSRYVAGEPDCTTAFWDAVDGKITITRLRELII